MPTDNWRLSLARCLLPSALLPASPCPALSAQGDSFAVAFSRAFRQAMFFPVPDSCLGLPGWPIPVSDSTWGSCDSGWDGVPPCPGSPLYGLARLDPFWPMGLACWHWPSTAVCPLHQKGPHCGYGGGSAQLRQPWCQSRIQPWVATAFFCLFNFLICKELLALLLLICETVAAGGRSCQRPGWDIDGWCQELIGEASGSQALRPRTLGAEKTCP